MGYNDNFDEINDAERRAARKRRRRPPCSILALALGCLGVLMFTALRMAARTVLAKAYQ